MRRYIACATTLSTLYLLLLSPLVSAQTVVISSTGSGWYNEAGFRGELNYVVGDLKGSCELCGRDYRNYFVFDLSSVVTPIASAKLTLSVPNLPPPNGVGYSSPDPSENYELHDVVTPLASLLNGSGGVAAHADLGSGIVYGSRTMTAADIGKIVEIELNTAGVAALNSASGQIGIGGSLTTLDGLVSDEYTFAFSGSTTDIRELRLTLVPEPSSFLVCLAAIFAPLPIRRRKSVPHDRG